MKRPGARPPGPARRVPVRKDRTVSEAAGRLPFLLHAHVLRPRSMPCRRVPEVPAGVREGGDGRCGCTKQVVEVRVDSRMRHGGEGPPVREEQRGVGALGARSGKASLSRYSHHAALATSESLKAPEWGARSRRKPPKWDVVSVAAPAVAEAAADKAADAATDAAADTAVDATVGMAAVASAESSAALPCARRATAALAAALACRHALRTRGPAARPRQASPREEGSHRCGGRRPTPLPFTRPCPQAPLHALPPRPGSARGCSGGW